MFYLICFGILCVLAVLNVQMHDKLSTQILSGLATIMLICIAGSLAVANAIASTLLGVVAFSSLWSILELFKQRERVAKGWFPANPKRQKRQ